MAKTTNHKPSTTRKLSRAGTTCPKPRQTLSSLKNSLKLSTETNGWEQLSELEKFVPVSGEPGATVNAVFIYEDSHTREWAGQAYDKLTTIASPESLRPTWWKLDNLTNAGVLAAAVSTAMRADVVVVAARAAEGLPLPFYTWVNSWMHNRRQFGGVMVALLGSPKANKNANRVEDFLREVSKQARLRFLVRRRKLAAVLESFKTHLVPGFDSAFMEPQRAA